VDDSGHVKVRLCHIRCYSVVLVRLCGISVALRETRILVSSTEMSVQSSITFTSIRTERLFAHRSSSSSRSIRIWQQDLTEHAALRNHTYSMDQQSST